MSVIEELEGFRKKDVPYRRVLGSMCTVPHPLAVKAHTMFIETNLGDPGIFAGTKELEDRLIRILGEFFGDPKVRGYVGSGGTESNIQAVRAFRNLKGVDDPNLVVPKSAHFSFDKLGDLLGVEIRKAELDDEFRVDPASVESLIDDRTIGIVGIAGTTEFGQIDPIDELSKIALERDIPLHVDAAFGGFVIPFLNVDVEFDFRLKGVTSLSVDPHKMGMATIPAGCIMFRGEEFLEALSVRTPYLTTERQYTLTGTRPGTGVASTYAVVRGLGFDWLRDVVRTCMRRTKILVEEMQSLGFEPVIEPVMNVACFHCESAERLKLELLKRGWVVSTVRNPKALRLVVMPHVDEEVIADFIDELRHVKRKVLKS